MINDASVVIGGGNWGIKEADVLGYKLINDEYYAREIDFANSTAAGTYTDSTGVIRKAPYNLAQYSEMFADAYWTKTASVTENTDAAPNGTLTADTFTDASNAYLDVRRSFTITASTAYTFSIFVKKTTGTLTNYPGVGFSAGGGVATGYAIFNTTTGAVNLADLAGVSVLSAESTSYGDYYRFEMTFTTAQTSLIVLIYPAISQNGTTLSSNAQGSNVFWGAQLVEGTEALPYFPTTTRLNVPRIDYRNADGSLSTVGRLLLESQRTNSMLFSQLINSWALKSELTITDNNTISPDGTQNASYIQQTTGGNAVTFQSQTVNLTTGQAQTISFYAKAKEVTSVSFRLGGVTVWSGGVRPIFTCDLLTGGITVQTGSITVSSQSVGNGWFRFNIVTAPTIASGGGSLQTPTGAVISPNSGDGFYLWGVQWEQNATYSTTYIPTTTAAVTRNADSASRTGVSSWIGQTEGTLFAVINSQTSGISSNWLNISDGTTNNWVFVGKDDTKWRAYVRAGSVIFNNTDAVIVNGQDAKIALAYKSGSIALYINGTQVATSAGSFTFSTSLSQISSGSPGAPASSESSLYAQALLFPTRLSNSQLQSLTTL